jgi:hypothetical protein
MKYYGQYVCLSTQSVGIPGYSTYTFGLALGVPPSITIHATCCLFDVGMVYLFSMADGAEQIDSIGE